MAELLRGLHLAHIKDLPLNLIRVMIFRNSD